MWVFELFSALFLVKFVNVYWEREIYQLCNIKLKHIQKYVRIKKFDSQNLHCILYNSIFRSYLLKIPDGR